MNSEQLCTLVVDALDDIKAQNVTTLDVRDMTSVTDYMIVASGTSNRHVQALADNVLALYRMDANERLTSALGSSSMRSAGKSVWVLRKSASTCSRVR